MVEKTKNQSIFTKILAGKNPMLDGVRWSERYANSLERIWTKLPKWLAHSILTIVIFILAAGIQGNLFL